MSFISWLTEPGPFGETALNEREPRRQPMHSRPSLERLEERTLLNATSGVIGGSFNNLNLNSNFNFASNGIVSPIATNNVLASSQHAVDPSGTVSSGTAAQAATSALPAQDQNNAQFRVFGVNSQGEDGSRIQQITANVLRDAYGFGTGTQPNAPWKPNAYNLGLGNHQPDYTTQTDIGFPSASSGTPQWSSPIARAQPRDQTVPLNKDEGPSINQDEEAPEATEQVAAHRSWREQEELKQDRLDKEAGDQDDELNALMQQQSSEKKAPIEAILPADGTLPDSLWLSALAPAPMAALIAGLPGIAEEGGDDAAAPE